MGRHTFEKVLSFTVWPYLIPVFVLSHSPVSTPTAFQEKVEFISGTPSEIVSTLKGRGFENLYIDGGRVIQSFLREDLIDELVSKRNKTQKDKDNLDLLRIKLGQLRNG